MVVETKIKPEREKKLRFFGAIEFLYRHGDIGELEFPSNLREKT